MSVLREEDDDDLEAMYAVIAYLARQQQDPEIEEWDEDG